MNHFSVCTGIGGIDLAAEWAGFTTVGQCEWADFQTKVLEKHWPNVPRWRDIRSVTSESVRAAGIKTITLLSAGLPCQPFSVAGNRDGAEDDRYLWPEMFRIVSEIRPAWSLIENVPGIITMEQPDRKPIMEDSAAICEETEMVLETIRRDYQRIGYESQPVVVPAFAVNARHRRDRIFIIAHAERNVSNSGIQSNAQANTTACPIGGEFDSWNYVSGRYWEQEPGISRAVPKFGMGGMVDGVSYGMERLNALGNAVVPAQVYPILKAIADIERSLHNAS